MFRVLHIFLVFVHFACYSCFRLFYCLSSSSAVFGVDKLRRANRSPFFPPFFVFHPVFSPPRPLFALSCPRSPPISSMSMFMMRRANRPTLSHLRARFPPFSAIIRCFHEKRPLPYTCPIFVILLFLASKTCVICTESPLFRHVPSFTLFLRFCAYHVVSCYTVVS